MCFHRRLVYRPNISVLGVSELLWWGFVEPLHLVNWHSHLGRNTIKYVFCVRANRELAQNTSLQLYLSMCGLAPCKMLTSNQTFSQGREPATKRCCWVKTSIYKKKEQKFLQNDKWKAHFLIDSHVFLKLHVGS